MKHAAPDQNQMIPVAVTAVGESIALLYSLTLPSKTKLFIYTAPDGANFSLTSEVKIITTAGKPEPLAHAADFHITTDGNTHYLTYVRTIRNRAERVVAASNDLSTFHVVAKTALAIEPLAIVPDHTYKDHFVAYLGSDSIRAAVTKDFQEWHITGPLLDRRNDEFDRAALRVIGATAIDPGILTVYDATDYAGDPRNLMIGAALFAYDQPYRPKWRSAFPVWETTLGKGDVPVASLGTICHNGEVRHYWRTQKNKVMSVSIPTSLFGPQPVEPAVALARHENNPIITPNAHNAWECEATFNPAAICLDGRVHLLYRAIGANGMSYIGHASGEDGINFEERSEQPVYIAKEHYAKLKAKADRYTNFYMSGGSWSGCEDPRMVKVDDTLYMTYTAFDGYHPPGMALTSIATSDFLAKNWNWTEPILISKPNQIQKNWVMFPEKIGGKFAFLHAINPKVRIDYFDDPLDAEMAIESWRDMKGDPRRWDNIMRGTATPPLRTNEGWLVLYHAMDKRDPDRYKLGAMLLDLDDPTKILHRSNVPVLEPNEWYENEGAKRGVVFACGSVIKDDTLFVYYGGADSVACVATAPLDEFIETIKCGLIPETELPLQTARITLSKLV